MADKIELIHYCGCEANGCHRLVEKGKEDNPIIDGDYYHDKASIRVEAFIEGLKYSGREVVVTKDNYTCEGCDPGEE